MSPECCFEVFSKNWEQKSRLTLSEINFIVSVGPYCALTGWLLLYLYWIKFCGEGQEDEGVWHVENILSRIQTFSCIVSVHGGVQFTECFSAYGLF